jgi:hypothetical protein
MPKFFTERFEYIPVLRADHDRDDRRIRQNGLQKMATELPDCARYGRISGSGVPWLAIFNNRHRNTFSREFFINGNFPQRSQVSVAGINGGEREIST